MIVQIDIDNTIDRSPEFFSWLSHSLKKDGHTVLIVSSRTNLPDVMAITKTELHNWKIDYDELHLSPRVNELDASLIPQGLKPAYHLYIYKLIIARRCKTQILFDDCSITEQIFKTYLPEVVVFRPTDKIG